MTDSLSALRETLERTLRETLRAKHVEMLVDASSAAVGDDVGDRMHGFNERYLDVQAKTAVDALLPPIASALEQERIQQGEKDNKIFTELEAKIDALWQAIDHFGGIRDQIQREFSYRMEKTRRETPAPPQEPT